MVKPNDMVDIFEESNVDAALAASIFHYDTHGVNRVKDLSKTKRNSCKNYKTYCKSFKTWKNQLMKLILKKVVV